MSHPLSTPRRRLLGALLAGGLTFAACGSDDGTGVRDLGDSGSESDSGSGSGSGSTADSGSSSEPAAEDSGSSSEPAAEDSDS